jgi:mannosylglycerate hydrolase
VTAGAYPGGRRAAAVPPRLDALEGARVSRPVRCVLLSHFHWDREWYRTFEAYRARLVDAVDRVLELLAIDPGFRFLLDGQTVLLEDYLALRPERREALARGVREGRLAIGPWYVQPDSLLPSGESHVRNLLRGRAVGAALGPVSRIAYVPDSFGHPAQFPQLASGFGLAAFVHWRGSGNEADRIATAYWWVAPDGSALPATLLRAGYFNAGCLPADVEAAAAALAAVAKGLDDGSGRPVLLLNGFDHMLPDGHIGAVADALARRTGAIVERGLLESAVEPPSGDLPVVRGDLMGARLANLLPGVWSTRIDVKLRARRCETLLTRWAEPWTALARRLGSRDERPALALAWQRLLTCQAHDSLCGCSTDAVMTQVAARLDEADGLAGETAARALASLAGLGVERRTPWTAEQDAVVFNPSPHRRTDVVRLPLDPYPALRLPLGLPELPPLLLTLAGSPGILVDGQPARVVESTDAARPSWLPGQAPLDVEFVVADVPAFGCQRAHLTPAAPAPDLEDDGRIIEAPGVQVVVTDDGTLDVGLGAATYHGLLAVEDLGDRGDTYDFDPVADDPGATPVAVAWRRWRHPSGLEGLRVDRSFDLPRALAPERDRRARDVVRLTVTTEARIAPGVTRVDLTVRVHNPAKDHRLRLRFPTGQPATDFQVATTFDVAARTTARPDDTRWVHPAPTTFVHQGWVHANGLTVVAPGLPEAEVTADGTIAITLLRAVGWLARFDVHSRPLPAGPMMAVPGAQCQGLLEARMALLGGCDPSAASDAEVGLWGILGGAAPVLAPGTSLLTVEPRTILLTACKPAESGDGVVVRVQNPTDAPTTAVLRPGFPIRTATAVRLDEEPLDSPVTCLDGSVRIDVPPRALRSVLLT